MGNSKTDLNQSIKRESFLKRYISENVLPYRFINFGRNTKLSKCIGLIGPRGSCKSLGAAAMGIMDYLVPGYSLISNMDVKWGLNFKGDIIGYKSEKLDKMEFLKFKMDDRIAVLIDEVNIEFSEARRSMTNRNLIFNKILQQLRKRQMNVIYTVQHEMWIDNRLRWQTDVFIKTMDICLRPGGIHLPYEFGEYASWKVFDMSGIFGQGTYTETMKPLIDGWRFNGKKWWNTFDTNEIQGIMEDSYGKMEGQQPSVVEAEANKWGWLADKVKILHEQGINEIPSVRLSQYIGQELTAKIRGMLKVYGVYYDALKQAYIVDGFDLENTQSINKPKELVYSK